jgi:hypothetical protein
MSRKRFTDGALIFSAMVLLSCFFTMMLVKAWDQEEASKPTRSQVITLDPDAAYHDDLLRANFIHDEQAQPENQKRRK